MPYWKKSELIRLRNVLFSLLFAVPLQPLPCTADTQSIIIREVQGSVLDDTYVLNAYIDYHFTVEAEKALNHGVPLQFITTIKIKKQRRWLWDKTMNTIEIIYRLQYHPLSEYYQVSSLNDVEHWEFKKLADVKEFLGKLENFPLVSSNMIVAGDDILYGEINVRLDIQSLPAPLRPLAYITRQWHLSSPVYSWNIRL